MKIRCLIIDDEPLARQGIREYIADVEFLQLAGEFDNALAAADRITGGEIDLLFLDINMPRISGVEFFKTLRNPPPVIFTTAYPEFALEGFELDALDYLVKPVSFERFLKAALRAREYYEVRRRNETARVEATETPASYFFIKADNRLVKIEYSEIMFAEALENYVVIHTTTKKYMTYLTFRAVEEYLPAQNFIRTHKSYIVAMNRVDAIEGNDLRVGDHLVPVSRNLREAVMNRLIEGKYLKRP